MQKRMAIAALLLVCGTTSAQRGLWVNKDEILACSASGAAWDDLVRDAAALGAIRLSDQDEKDDSRLLAATIVAIKTGGDLRPLQAIALAAMGTEDGGRTLALGRNLQALVLAADLLEFNPEQRASFSTWLASVRYETLDGRTLVSTHEERGNNWHTHAGAARIAADLYLRDYQDLRRASQVLAGWMGYEKAYAGFEWGDLDWQADPAHPFGINPPGSTIQGHSVDGVLPDDQRRAGGFMWPPPKENYCYEAFQGFLVQLVLLDRAGLPAWRWKSSAPLRAFSWLNVEAAYPAEGDDVWMPPIVNRIYGTDFAVLAGSHGKALGWSEFFLQLPEWP